MNNNNSFFQPARNILGGYYIWVRNDWSYNLKKRHLTEKQKELYERDFDHQIILDRKFLEWLEKIFNELNN